jgi:hypothetical protein
VHKARYFAISIQVRGVLFEAPDPEHTEVHFERIAL